MFSLTIPLGPLAQVIDTIAHRVGETEPLMAGIAVELLDQTERNFEEQGRPAWPELAAATKAQRAKRGHWPGKLLQVSGALARSAHASHGHDFAQIATGADIPYAAIQHFGGEAGNGTVLPARPYLPMVGTPDDVRLQPEAEEAILELALGHLQWAGRV